MNQYQWLHALLHRDTPEREKPPETPPELLKDQSPWAHGLSLDQEAKEGKGHWRNSVGPESSGSFWCGRKQDRIRPNSAFQVIGFSCVILT